MCVTFHCFRCVQVSGGDIEEHPVPALHPSHGGRGRVPGPLAHTLPRPTGHTRHLVHQVDGTDFIVKLAILMVKHMAYRRCRVKYS